MNKKTLLITIGIVSLGSFILIYTLLFLNSTMTCSSSGKSNGITIDQKYTINYTSDTILDMIITKSYTFEDQKEFDTFKNTLIPTTNNQMSELENKYIKFSNQVNKSSYITKLIVNVKKTNSKELKTIGINKSLTEMKTQLVDQGLTCK